MGEHSTSENPALPGWRRSAFAAISCVSIVGMAFGLSLPLLAFNLEFMTHSGTIIGLNALCGALSTIIIAPFAPAILARVPTRPFMIACLAYLAASFVAYRVLPSVPVWMMLRFTSGVAVTLVFVISETWIVQLAPNPVRGRVLGFYSMALAIGFGLGGVIVTTLGVHGWPPFAVGAGITLMAVFPLLLPGPGLHMPTRAHATLAGLWRIIRAAPRLMVAALAFGAIETTANNFGPIWAFRAGYGEAASQFLVVAGALGVIALQLPLGWLADRGNRKRLLMGCALAAMAGPFMMFLAGGSHSMLVYPVFFFYVGLVEGLYIIALALIGERFSLSQMTAASAALITMYGVGSLLGPLIAGPLMDAINPAGAMLGLFLIGAIYPLAALLRPMHPHG